MTDKVSVQVELGATAFMLGTAAENLSKAFEEFSRVELDINGEVDKISPEIRLKIQNLNNRTRQLKSAASNLSNVARRYGKTKFQNLLLIQVEREIEKLGKVIVKLGKAARRLGETADDYYFSEYGISCAMESYSLALMGIGIASKGISDTIIELA